jgi:nuclear protein localization family protein 4
MNWTDNTQLSKVLPETVDFNTLILSNAPTGGQEKLIKEILSFEIGKLGVK